MSKEEDSGTEEEYGCTDSGYLVKRTGTLILGEGKGITECKYKTYILEGEAVEFTDKGINIKIDTTTTLTDEDMERIIKKLKEEEK